ncbi:hypothetical protein Tcan_01993 [Toxocara canis]|uniref:Uncharacterized protein n=1 Tax=Toxocara canis TaxID=6265 RepID=A0A0B2UTR6_TOXCA|nr:hypothetical protein Tcan_01993 [Toxocara canis]
MAFEAMRNGKGKWFTSEISFAQKEWPNRGHEASNQLDLCFWRYLRQNATICPAHLKCTPNITAVGMDDSFRSGSVIFLPLNLYLIRRRNSSAPVTSLFSYELTIITKQPVASVVNSLRYSQFP